MTAAFPSSQNVFLRDHNASNKMVVDYARNVNDFPLNKYVQVVPTPKVAGLYLNMTIEEAGRIKNTDLADFSWYDGNPAPEGNDGLESHEWKAFECVRRAFPFTLGQLTVDQASWDIVAHHASIKSRQAMTARTQLAITELTTSGNYPTGHYLDVTSTSDIPGVSGSWEQSTTARQDIQRSIDTAIEKILDDTLNGVKPEDLVLVISSALAMRIRLCQELVDYIKGSPEALAQVRGELPGGNVHYGLPGKLYGVNLVVEDTRKVTSKKGATRAASQIMPVGNALLLSRPGGLVGVAGAPNFSSCVIFAQEEMSVEKRDDPDNRRVKGRVVENIVAKLVAPAASVLFTACAS